MSDYLSNLAARHANLADVIQPRLASRFEPTRVNGVLGLRTAVPSITDDEDGTADPAAQASMHQRQAPRAAPEVATTDANAVRQSLFSPPQPFSPTARETNMPAGPGQEGATAQSETTIAPPLLPRPVLRGSPPGAPMVTASPHAAQWSDRDTRTPTSADRLMVSADVRPPAADVTLRPPESKHQPIVQSIIQSSTERVVIEQRTAPSAQVREQPSLSAPNAVVVQPRVTRVDRFEAQSRNSDTLPLPAQAPPLAPTIHVTIGRIEVRATAPAAPPPQQRPTPRRMSLDEYLTQRSSGGRR